MMKARPVERHARIAMGGIAQRPVGSGVGRLEPAFDHAVLLIRIKLGTAGKEKQRPSGMRHDRLLKEYLQLMKLDRDEIALQRVVDAIPPVWETPG